MGEGIGEWKMEKLVPVPEWG